jgi:hypothetical protein
MMVDRADIRELATTLLLVAASCRILTSCRIRLNTSPSLCRQGVRGGGPSHARRKGRISLSRTVMCISKMNRCAILDRDHAAGHLTQ